VTYITVGWWSTKGNYWESGFRNRTPGASDLHNCIV